MKPPRKIGLLATQEELSEYQEDRAKYEIFVTNFIKSESGFFKDIDLLLFLAENYHPKLRMKKKVGAKTKWDDHLNTVIAVEIDSLKKICSTRKKAIEQLIADPLWASLVKNSKDPFSLIDKADKAGHKKKHIYNVYKEARQYAIETNSLDKYKKEIAKGIQNASRKD